MDVIVETLVEAPIEAVWRMFNEPADILMWDTSDDWYTTSVSNDLKVGARLQLRIESRLGGAGFDFGATYIEVQPMTVIARRTDEGRHVRVEFRDASKATLVHQTFEAEAEPSINDQRRDWQAVLDNFARHVAAQTFPS